jgi:hypothetical protein
MATDDEPKAQYISQGYPLSLAYARSLSRAEDPLTPDGRMAIAVHAGLSDADLREYVETAPVVGWAILPGDRSVHPITPEGIFDGPENDWVFAIGEYCVEQVLGTLQSQRETARERCERHGLTPWQGESEPLLD